MQFLKLYYETTIPKVYFDQIFFFKYQRWKNPVFIWDLPIRHTVIKPGWLTSHIEALQYVNNKIILATFFYLEKIIFSLILSTKSKKDYFMRSFDEYLFIRERENQTITNQAIVLELEKNLVKIQRDIKFSSRTLRSPKSFWNQCENQRYSGEINLH